MAEKLRVLDLFSGIGGFSLGLERTGGFETVAFCEIEEFPRRVLAKHWPEVPCYHDVRELTAERLAADGIAVDVICGGFPCQDISVAGKGEGIAGSRSGLWSEIRRLARDLGPRYIILENVAALLGRGLGTVLGDLAAIGYDAEWHCIQAADLGAPHIRDRIWIIAHANGGWWRADVAGRDDSNGDDAGWLETHCLLGEIPRPNPSWYLADPFPANDDGQRRGQYYSPAIAVDPKHTGLTQPISHDGWATAWPQFLESICRVDDGLRGGLDKAGFGTLGNTIVPQIPELIGRAILATHTHPSHVARGVGGGVSVSHEVNS